MRIRVIIPLLAVSFCCAGCHNKEKDLPEEPQEMSFNASFAEAIEVNYFWGANEQIGIFCGTEFLGTFTSTNTESVATAVFKGTPEKAPHQDGDYLAVYPYSENSTLDEKGVLVDVPSVQAAIQGTFAHKSFPAIAQSNNHDLAFYSVLGGVRFSVPREGITRVVFKSEDSIPLAGKIKANFSVTGKPLVAEILESVYEISVNAPDGGFVPGKYYYAAMIPATHPKPFVVISTCGNNQTTLELEQPLSIARATFSSVDESAFDQIIEFDDPEVKRIVLSNFDKNKDGQITTSEAAAVKDLGLVFYRNKTLKTFNELRYFTGLNKLGEYAFADCSNLSAIILPGNLAIIDKYAFYQCGALASIDLPNSITTIGEGAFSYCSLLSSIEIPQQVTRIEDKLFMGSALESISLPDGLQSIGNSAFYACRQLKSIDIPDNVSSIDPFAFCWCDGLESFDIPANVTGIDKHVFAYCSGIKSIAFPDKLVSIGLCAFQCCNGLVELDLPSTVTIIESSAFFGCKNLKSLIIPAKVTSISSDLFSNCPNLESVTLPDGITSIGKDAFMACPKLLSISIPKNVTSIGSSAFRECTALTSAVINATVPPDGGNQMFEGTNCPIYVPAESVDAYKQAQYWSDYSDRISAITE